MSLPLNPTWKRGLVIGLGRSGAAAAALLAAMGLEVNVYDQRPDAPIEPNWQPFLGATSVPQAAFEQVDLIVVSPGIKPAPILQAAQRWAADVPIYGEMSLGLALAKVWWPALPTVLITGTNGKSTVTTLTGELLAQGGLAPFVGGNLGDPLCELLAQVHRREREAPGSLVLECSSYQLETLHDFACDVAMLLNLSCDHLDRYGTMAAYGATKARVFSGLRHGGLALLDAQDPYTPGLVPLAGAQVLLVDGEHPPHRVDRAGEEWLVVDHGMECLRSTLRLTGQHNAKNALFSLKAALHLGVSWSQCMAVLERFAGLAHRMGRVATVAGVDFFNDSKATNVAGVVAGLSGFPQPYVLIAGGMAKAGDDPTPLRELLQAQGRGLVAMGRDGQLFYELAKDLVPVRWAQDMAEAVDLAYSLAQPGDAVVLSPACASWDAYRSFAHRGDTFIAEVARLEEAVKTARGRTTSGSEMDEKK